MSKKQKNTKEILKDFVPSTGNESYLQTGKVILEGGLPVIAAEINTLYAEGISLAQRATKAMIGVGKLLITAREQFPSDAKFGKWRKKMIEFSQSHSQRLMAVAKEFGDNEDALLLPVGTLAVLLPASPKLKQEVIEEAKAGDKPTRAEVIERKKEDKVSPPEGDVTVDNMLDERPDVPAAVVPEVTIEPWEKAQILLNMPLIQRITLIEVDDTNDAQHNAFVIFGIPPFHDGLPSIDLLHAVYHESEKVLGFEATSLQDKMTKAYDILIELCNN